MLPDSFLARNMVYALAVAQTAIAPLAFAYYVYYMATDQPLFSTRHETLDTFVHYWLGCELIFYVFFEITRSRLQSMVAPVFPDAKDRRHLYYNCVANIDNVEEWLTGWFMRSHAPSEHPSMDELYRDNLAEWISWAFFARPLELSLEDDAVTEELNWIVDDFSAKFNITLTPGYNDDVVACRHTLEPVQAYHRPLAFYLMIMTTTVFTQLILRFFWGMERYGPDLQSSFSLWSTEIHPTSPTLRPSNVTSSVVYWFREGDRSKKPIVFVHGIGPGFAPYLVFISNLLRLGAPMFCVEQPHVAMRCIEHVPTMQDTVRDLERMLSHHGFSDAVFVGHSLGTGVMSWAIQHCANRVAGMVFLDPICFMLHYKDICINFVYRVPKTAAESIVKYFASSELYISYFISRHFHWFQMALYVTPMSDIAYPKNGYNTTSNLPRSTKVFLSAADNIVDSARVSNYLSKNGVDAVVMDGMDHGWFLAKRAWQKEIIDTVADFIAS
ncbi:Alpha/Beta hydrolase protein [Dichotomocladium elegans]|nr:Alpha/Beta hydrolase protein [Dichotomocladium elegans]